MCCASESETDYIGKQKILINPELEHFKRSERIKGAGVCDLDLVTDPY